MDKELIEQLARKAGAKEQGVGQGGAYRELVMSAWIDGDVRMAAFARFAALIAEECAKEAESYDCGPGLKGNMKHKVSELEGVCSTARGALFDRKSSSDTLRPIHQQEHPSGHGAGKPSANSFTA